MTSAIWLEGRISWTKSVTMRRGKKRRYIKISNPCQTTKGLAGNHQPPAFLRLFSQESREKKPSRPCERCKAQDCSSPSEGSISRQKNLPSLARSGLDMFRARTWQHGVKEATNVDSFDSTPFSDLWCDRFGFMVLRCILGLHACPKEEKRSESSLCTICSAHCFASAAKFGCSTEPPSTAPHPGSPKTSKDYYILTD